MTINVVYINKRAEENAALISYVAWLDSSGTAEKRAERVELVRDKLTGRGSNGRELMDLVERLIYEGF